MAKRKSIIPDESATYEFAVDDATGSEKRVRIGGRLSITNAHRVHEDLGHALARSPHRRLVIDLTGLAYIDGAGAAILVETERSCRQGGIEFDLIGLRGDVEGLLSLVDRKKLSELKKIVAPKPISVPVEIGEKTLDMLADVRKMFVFVGDATLALTHAALHPGSVRWRDTLYYMERAGADALPIVGLISLLMGMILGFQAVLQLSQFGANIFCADLVGLSVLRELGPLMTCILVAGRSGSAFAAEIGTMKVSEEVDALATMGFDPVRFLVVPKVIALVLMVPLLTLYADFLGLVGGMIVGTTQGGVTLSAYIAQSYEAIGLWDISQGLIKCTVFAMIIALVGCMRGFQVRGGAASVGQYTTSAVVTGIFLIIVADAVFTVLFTYFG